MGGGAGMVFAIVFLTIFAMSLFGSLFAGPAGQPGQVDSNYNEAAFQDYTDDLYAQYFSASEDYEDHILLVVLTEEDHYGFYYMAWVGDHVNSRINYMLGNNETELGRAMNSCINETNYKYSLDSDLRQVMTTMADQIAALNLETPYTCGNHYDTPEVKFVNNTQLAMTEATVMEGLNAFAEKTGLPLVLVVEDAADVFVVEKQQGSGLRVVSIVLLVIIVVLIVVLLLARKKKPATDPDDRNAKYRQFDDQY